MRKKLFKLLLLLVFVFSFSFSLASCGVDDPVEPTNSGSANTPTPTATPTGTNTSSSSTTEEEIFEIDSNYYLNLLSEKNSFELSFKDLVVSVGDVNVTVDDSSCINVGVLNEKVLINAYIKASYTTDRHASSVKGLEIWASLDENEFIIRGIETKTPGFFTGVTWNARTAIPDAYSQTIIYKEFSLSKDLVFGKINEVVNSYLKPDFDMNEVEKLNDITSLFGIDTEEIDKAYVASEVETLLGQFFDYVIDENVTWTFKFDKINEAVDTYKDLTISDIIDSKLGEGTASKIVTLFNPENTMNIGKYTLNDLLITSEDDEVGYVKPEDIDKVVDTAFDMLPAIIKMNLFDIPEGASAFLNKDMIINMVSSMLGETPIKKVEVTEWKDNVTYYVIDDGEPTPVDTKTVTAPVEGTDYFVLKNISELFTEESLKKTVNELAANIYAFIMNMNDPDFDQSKLENFDITKLVYPYIAGFKDLTIYGIAAQFIDMMKDEEDIEFVEATVTEWEKDVLYFTKNDTEYEVVDTETVTAPVSGTKYYVIKHTTADDLYSMIKNALTKIEETTVLSFTTDKEANILNASATFDNAIISGTITLDFTKEYSDELHEELTTYIPYARVKEEGSVNSFKEILNDNVFDDLPEFELFKEDNKIVGIKYTHIDVHNTSQSVTDTLLFDVPSTSKVDPAKLEVQKEYCYGNVWEYTVKLYFKEKDKTETLDELFYDTEAKKFIVKEYDEDVVVQDSDDCSKVKIVKYTNKAYENDYYYQITYYAHHATEWFVEEIGVDEDGDMQYDIYIMCDHCNQKVLIGDGRSAKASYHGKETFNDVDVEFLYYPVTQKVRYYSTLNLSDIELVTSQYPVTSEVLSGLPQMERYEAYKYPSNGIIIIYLDHESDTNYDGLIVLNLKGEVIGRFGSGIVKN